MFSIALAVLLAAADATPTPTPDATPAPAATPEPITPPALARGAAIRLVLDDGAIVEGTIGDVSNLAILVRLPAGGFRVVDRARVVEPPEARLEPTIKELRDAAVPPTPGPSKSAVTPWGGWITAGLGPGSLGSGAAGAFSVRYRDVHASFRYENRRERFTRKEPETSNYSFGVLGGRTWRFREDDLLRVSVEGGAGVTWGQERGAFIDTERRGPGCPGSANCDTFYIYETERYRAPALLGDVSVSLHPRIGFCAPDSTGIGLAVSGAVRPGGAEALFLVFLQLGAL